MNAKNIGQYAAIHGLKLYVEVHGDGPPLVLLHGGGSTIDTSFGTTLPVYAKRRRVIAFDQQGHGRTADLDDRPFSFEQSADDTAALIRHFKLERVDLVGFSNGASIALQVAMRHPTLVRKVVSISGMTKKTGAPPEFWAGMNHASLDDMPAILRETYQKVAPHPEKLQSFHDKSVARMLGFVDFPIEQVRAIRAPVLVMSGDHDVTTVEHAVELFRTLPHAELAILPNTDHETIVTRVDLQVPVVERFLDAPMPTGAQP